MNKHIKSGFTLVELLIVLVITAIALGFVYGLYTTVYVKLSNQARLDNTIQRIYYLFVSTRREAFLKNQIFCIKYANKKFSSFVDNDLDGVSDNGNEVTVEIPDEITVYINGSITNDIKIYSRDALFLKFFNDSFSSEYSNMEIKLQLDQDEKVLKITNSLPEILE
ncbi:pilus assembly FimT family protein [Thermosipho atlanticus]|uniref:Prepilin-type N-terminal cleavage/methylation domain-containing protein n=1 Tax=Thermosipho atlanticus DSM 15807 TaxID=1123380 RepID=A0A1M5RRS9_9BACT|nr:prepilin-type N-terminal cleavage/methylation domain-containing protein [Thermosipho atlanticus]SHH28977.1 prepilin-type N-terminal cleavage/methylation domain-containing protein [Thermosipho atlanticus DSM 15807]